MIESFCDGWGKSALRRSIDRCRSALIVVGLASAIINILYLSGSFYMMQVYDRVIPSRSIPTLVGLSFLILALYGFQAVLDFVRSRMLVRVGRMVDEGVSDRVYLSIARNALTKRGVGDGLQPLRDLDHVRSFVGGPGPLAMFDLPWMPFYIALCFLFHLWIGVTALAGMLVLIVLTFLTERYTKRPASTAMSVAIRRNAIAESSRRNAEVMRSMGMAGRVAVMWAKANADYLNAQQRASDIVGGVGAVSKAARMLLQSAMLGVGAYLVVNQQATGGVIIAASVIGSRALAPIDQAIAQWKSFVGCRQGWKRLNELLADDEQLGQSTSLPRPALSLEVISVSVAPPGEQRLVVQDVSFRVECGCGLGIVGQSGSGKSSLLRALIGAWAPQRGVVRLDGAATDQWNSEALGEHIGYLPQDIELFAGTVAQNISRFEPGDQSVRILTASKLAGVHDLILGLPRGYDTEIGEGGTALSAGQRQRVALARALYGDPFLVVLDEPNSNLDAEGENALRRAILSVRERGGIVVVVSHRNSVLASLDRLLVMSSGRLTAFGERDEVLERMKNPQQSATAMSMRQRTPEAKTA